MAKKRKTKTKEMGNLESVLKECELKYCLPQICKALLSAACLACPTDPILFLQNTILAFQGNDSLQDVDWHNFFADVERYASKIHSLRCGTMDTGACIDPDDNVLSFGLLQKAYCCYRKNLTGACFRYWKSFTLESKRDARESAAKMDRTKRHLDLKCQQAAITKWVNWVKLRKTTNAVAMEKLKRLVDGGRLRRIIATWNNVAIESKGTRDYFKKLEKGLIQLQEEDQQTGGESDRLSLLPCSLASKIFQHLELRDWLTCAEVCCAWKAVIQSGTLWSQINVSVEKDWITDCVMKEILQNYHPFVTHLNLRGCTSLTWSSLICISECKNLQELNVSECFNVTDIMVQKIVEGCPCLLYLNLSCTLVTNKTLSELSRSCRNLQYLSLAYCNRFTDNGFLYLTTGKGCHNLIHLNLSGCTQMTVDGFQYLSAGCPSLKEVVLNDMPTLSNSCVLALLARCHCLSAISLLDALHLTDIAFKAIAEEATLKSFSIEGNNQLSSVSWKALCSRSQGLQRLHVSECLRMSDNSLKSVATLNNLQYLDISLCRRVSDVGISHLTGVSSVNQLQELNISHCSLITDISVKRIAERLCKLHHLNLSYCAKLTNLSLEWLNGSSVCSLDVSGCNIQDKGLDSVEGTHLIKLVLAECVHITDFGIEKLCKNVGALQHVDVSHCEALSDSAIRAISFYCRSLFTLRMAGCPKMTDIAVKYVTTGSRYLRELDVSGCVLLTDRTVQLLERICPPLHSIAMTCCCSISKVAALKLQPRVKHWEHSNDYTPY